MTAIEATDPADHGSAASAGAASSSAEPAAGPGADTPLEAPDPRARPPALVGAGERGVATEARLEAASAHVLGLFAIAVAHAVVLDVTLPAPGRHAVARAWVHLYDAGHAIALGILVGAAIGAFRLAAARAGLRSRLWPWIAGSLGAAALGVVLMWDDVAGPAERIGGESGALTTALQATFAAAAAQVVPGAALAGRLVARPYLRWVALPAACAAAAGNHFVLTTGYRGAHLFIAWSGAALLGAALTGAALPVRLASASCRGARARVAWALAALVGAAALSIPPSNDVRVDMLRPPGSIVSPLFAEMHGSDEAFEWTVPPEMAAWFVDRRKAPDVPPSDPPVLPDGGIVVLLGVDSLRADVLEGGKYRAELPNLSAMREAGVVFTNARAPGSQTVSTLSSIFAGTYFSQQYWTHKNDRRAKSLFPFRDDTVRFPELLGRAGVATVHVASKPWLRNEWGVARGFAEDPFIDTPEKHPDAKDLMDPLLDRLARHGSGSLFLFTHFLDAHEPYDKAGRRGSAFQRYLGELALVDEQLGRLVAFLDARGLRARTLIVVTSDHGEAFGEHGSSFHGTTLYDELLRVPLVFSAPFLTPCKVDAPVSLIDLGPTLLDLFRVKTPGHMMGESLAGFLRGKPPRLTRPIVAEGRLKQALVSPEGLKVIHDRRSGTTEVYDLRSDPKETKNLFGGGDARSRRMLDILLTFFQVHTIDRPGYRPPYRP